MPVVSSEIEIAEDDDPIEESLIESTDPTQETKIIDVSDIVMDEVDEEVTVNWVTIEEVPIFPGCEKEKDKRACFNAMMQLHMRKNFRYSDMAKELGLEGRVNAHFIINKDQSIVIIRKMGVT